MDDVLLGPPLPERPPTAAEARIHLAAFLRWTADLLAEIGNPEGSFGDLADLFLDGALQGFGPALDELNAEGHVARAEDAIGGVSDEALVAHGLRGWQLMWKLALLSAAFEAFSAATVMEAARGWKLERLLDIIETILDSLIDAILETTPYGAALKELVKLLKGAVARQI